MFNLRQAPRRIVLEAGRSNCCAAAVSEGLQSAACVPCGGDGMAGLTREAGADFRALASSVPRCAGLPAFAVCGLRDFLGLSPHGIKRVIHAAALRIRVAVGAAILVVANRGLPVRAGFTSGAASRIKRVVGAAAIKVLPGGQLAVGVIGQLFCAAIRNGAARPSACQVVAVFGGVAACVGLAEQLPAFVPGVGGGRRAGQRGGDEAACGIVGVAGGVASLVGVGGLLSGGVVGAGAAGASGQEGFCSAACGVVVIAGDAAIGCLGAGHMAGFGVAGLRDAAQRVSAPGLAARCVVFIAAGAAKFVRGGRDLAGCVIRRLAGIARRVLVLNGSAQQVIRGFFTQPGLAVFDLLPFGVVVPCFHGAVRVRGLVFSPRAL